MPQPLDAWLARAGIMNDHHVEARAQPREIASFQQQRLRRAHDLSLLPSVDARCRAAELDDFRDK